jgi:hypothetical protein
MSERCKHVEKNGFNCGSYAFNLYKDGIDQGNLCDVHYWQAKALAQPEQDHIPDARKMVTEQEPVVGIAAIRTWFKDGRVVTQTLCNSWIDTTPPQQEPVAWMDADGNVSDNNDHKCFPIPLYTTPPQRTERPVDCERCNRLEEQAYDLVGKLRVANIKLSMQPQSTWVGLTDEEYTHITDTVFHTGQGLVAYYKAIEAKLKEKNI